MKCPKKYVLILITLLISFISFSLASIIDVRKGIYQDKVRYVFDVKDVSTYKVHQEGRNIIIEIGDRKFIYTMPYIPSSVKSFMLQNPERIVIDIYKPIKTQKDSILNIISPKYAYLLKDRPISKNTAYNEDQDPLSVVDKKYLEAIESYPKSTKPYKYIPHPKGVKVVVIDPGHGGKDSGAIGIGGVEEKNIVLAIGKKLDFFLKHDPRFKVIMTRDKDVFIPLQQRARIAIENRADLFISIHCNMAPGHITWPHGTNIYFLSNPGIDMKYNELVNNEAFAHLVFGNAVYEPSISARKVLARLALDITKNQSFVFAKDLAYTLDKDLHKHVDIHNIHRRNFVVLRTPGIPSVLVETGFISNPHDVKELTNPSYQWAFAKAMYEAIVDYFFGSNKNEEPQNNIALKGS
ncbi:N-acetylmuramoyl-L-alanine amidase family protein [Hydrogenobaculum acidophilum]